MFNTLKHYKLWFTISGLILLFGAVSLIMFGLKLGIDFKGGTMMEVQFQNSYNIQDVRGLLDGQGLKNYQLQSAENNSLLVKTENLSSDQHNKVLQALQNKFIGLKETQLQSIGPVIGQQLRQDSVYELILVSLGIIFYIAYAFRKIAKPVTSWRFGWAAVIALFHDLLFVLGIFSILGHFKGVEVDSLFVTGMLTVLGFSVHDTIVVFDRIRENLKIYAGESIEFVVNHSISQTVVRSLNTSLTVLFVLLALLLFGGDTIRWFVFTLFIGIIVGTYSSIFIASPVLVLWQKWKTRNI